MIRIFHPTDFSPAREVAFIHALKLALASRGALTIFHFAREADAEDDAREFPRVRETLMYWGLLQPGSPREAVGALGLRVRKVGVGGARSGRRHVELSRKPPRRSDGAHHSPAQRRRPVVVPGGGVAPGQSVDSARTVRAAWRGRFRGLQYRSYGPTADRAADRPASTSPPQAIATLPAIVGAFHAGPVAVELLHIGRAATLPHVHLPDTEGWTWTTRVTDGDVVEGILRTAAEGQADLLVLTTRGRRGFLDALRGSTTERVVRGAHCRVLAVPTLQPATADDGTAQLMPPVA